MKLFIETPVIARMPTPAGDFQLHVFLDKTTNKEHLALVKGDVAGKENVLVRVHSECFTGDVLGSMRCDCGDQLHRAMEAIAQAECGVLIYLRQEGRGIGLVAKLQAYNLQDRGMDTIDANLALGHQADEREYSIAAFILQQLQVVSIRLITNNPHKIISLRELGVCITERTSLDVSVNPENEGYLRTKANRMDHLINLDESNPDNEPGDEPTQP